MPAARRAPNEYTVSCRWDSEAGVWYVDDSDVPGLATGADTLDGLVRKLQTLIPELLEANAKQPSTPEIHFVVHADAHASHAA